MRDERRDERRDEKRNYESKRASTEPSALSFSHRERPSLDSIT